MKTLYTSLVLALVPSLLFAVNRIETSLTMSDGVSVAISLFVPDGAVPEEGFPAILSAHGFGGSRTGNAARARRYADSGYVALTWSVRGQGGPVGTEDASLGRTNWLTDERMVEDIRELLAWLASRSDVRADRIGMEGISQGGLMTWRAAVEGLPIRCARLHMCRPPMCGWTARSRAARWHTESWPRRTGARCRPWRSR